MIAKSSFPRTRRSGLFGSSGSSPSTRVRSSTSSAERSSSRSPEGFRLFFKTEWSEAIFRDDPIGRRRAVNWARLVTLFHAAVIAVGVALELWMLPVVVTLGSFIGSWWKVFVGFTMHAGLRDNVADFRKCARSVKLDPFSRFIYWNMNYHIEHHMFGAIPCYNLRKLSREIAWDMPKPRSIREAWREMRDTWERQQTDPAYQFDTPVPENSPSDERDIDHEAEHRSAISNRSASDGRLHRDELARPCEDHRRSRPRRNARSTRVLDG